MKKGPAFFTGETNQTPPPSRFTPLASQSKARVVPGATATASAMKTRSSSATPMRSQAQLNQSRLSMKKSAQLTVDFKQDDENTPKSSLNASSAWDESMQGTKMVRISPLSEEREDVGAQLSSNQLLNHSVQIAELQRQVEELTNENRRLTEITDQQTATIQEIANAVMEQKAALQKLEVLGTILGTLVPSPVSLTYFRPAPDSIIVSWESELVPLAVQGFEISLNGVPSGCVTGRSKRAILTPLDPNQEYRISVQAVSQFDDIRSVKTDLVIPRLQDEGGKKDDTDESMGERMNAR